MGGGTPTQPTQSTTTTLSPQADQLFQAALPGVLSYASQVPQRYSGTTIAPFSPGEIAGGQNLLTAAQTQGEGTTAALTGALGTLGGVPGSLDWNPNTTPFVPGATPNYSSNIFEDPGIWNPQFNAGTKASIDAATRPIFEGLTEQALPAIRSAAVGTGGFGGSRQGIAEGLASGRASRAAGDTAAKIVEDLYGANLNAANSRYATNLGAANQRYQTDVSGDQARYATNTGLEAQRYGTNYDALLRSIGMTPQLASSAAQSSLLAPGVQIGLGEQERSMQQAQINAAVQGYNYDQLAPFLQSKDILSLVMGLPGQTTTATGNTPTASPWLQSAGGALTGAAAGSTFGPIGTGIGAVGGGLLPWLTR